MFLPTLFWFVLALVFAALEIESEGKYGWAQKMPTWYRKTGLAAAIYGRLMGGKPLTGYHSFMFFLPIMVFHAGFALGAPWSLKAELMTWAMYFAWCPLWDYLWFVLNPEYGAENFRQKNVWWHAQSPWVLGRFPADYLAGAGLSIGFAALAAWNVGDAAVVTQHLKVMGLLLAMTFATILFVGKPYRAWRTRMLAHDERHLAGIFHADEVEGANVRKTPRA